MVHLIKHTQTSWKWIIYLFFGEFFIRSHSRMLVGMLLLSEVRLATINQCVLALRNARLGWPRGQHCMGPR